MEFISGANGDITIPEESQEPPEGSGRFPGDMALFFLIPQGSVRSSSIWMRGNKRYFRTGMNCCQNL